MSRRLYEQMIEEMELANFHGYHRWQAMYNPAYYAVPDMPLDFRCTPRFNNRPDLLAMDYSRQLYWMPQEFYFPFSESYLLRRNDRHNVSNKNYQFYKGKKNNSGKKSYQCRQEEKNVRADQAKKPEFLNQLERKSQPSWKSDAPPSQHFNLACGERNPSGISFRNSTVDLGTENIMADQHFRNLSQAFENRSSLSEVDNLQTCMNMSQNMLDERGMQSNDSYNLNYCSHTDLDWKDLGAESNFSDAVQYVAPPTFTNSYDSWYCPEEQQQIVDMLKEVDLRHEIHLRRNMNFTNEKKIVPIESKNNDMYDYEQRQAPQSSDDEEEDVIILLSPQEALPIPEITDKADVKDLKNDCEENSARDFFEEFQNIYTGTPEKNIINNLTKESLKKPLDLDDEDEKDAISRIITEDDKNAVKTVLKFENTDFTSRDHLETVLLEPSASPQTLTPRITNFDNGKDLKNEDENDTVGRIITKDDKNDVKAVLKFDSTDCTSSDHLKTVLLEPLPSFQNLTPDITRFNSGKDLCRYAEDNGKAKNKFPVSNTLHELQPSIHMPYTISLPCYSKDTSMIKDSLKLLNVNAQKCLPVLNLCNPKEVSLQKPLNKGGKITKYSEPMDITSKLQCFEDYFKFSKNKSNEQSQNYINFSLQSRPVFSMNSNRKYRSKSFLENYYPKSTNNHYKARQNSKRCLDKLSNVEYKNPVVYEKINRYDFSKAYNIFMSEKRDITPSVQNWGKKHLNQNNISNLLQLQSQFSKSKSNITNKLDCITNNLKAQNHLTTNDRRQFSSNCSFINRYKISGDSFTAPKDFSANVSEKSKSASEPFLGKKNDVVYKKISLSEIFSHVNEELTEYQETLLRNQRHIQNLMKRSEPSTHLSPSEHLKQILGISNNSENGEKHLQTNSGSDSLLKKCNRAYPTYNDKSTMTSHAYTASSSQKCSNVSNDQESPEVNQNVNYSNFSNDVKKKYFQKDKNVFQDPKSQVNFHKNQLRFLETKENLVEEYDYRNTLSSHSHSEVTQDISNRFTHKIKTSFKSKSDYNATSSSCQTDLNVKVKSKDAHLPSKVNKNKTLNINDAKVDKKGKYSTTSIKGRKNSAGMEHNSMNKFQMGENSVSFKGVENNNSITKSKNNIMETCTSQTKKQDDLKTVKSPEGSVKKENKIKKKYWKEKSAKKQLKDQTSKAADAYQSAEIRELSGQERKYDFSHKFNDLTINKYEEKIPESIAIDDINFTNSGKCVFTKKTINNSPGENEINSKSVDDSKKNENFQSTESVISFEEIGRKFYNSSSLELSVNQEEKQGAFKCTNRGSNLLLSEQDIKNAQYLSKVETKSGKGFIFLGDGHEKHSQRNNFIEREHDFIKDEDIKKDNNKFKNSNQDMPSIIINRENYTSPVSSIKSEWKIYNKKNCELAKKTINYDILWKRFFLRISSYTLSSEPYVTCSGFISRKSKFESDEVQKFKETVRNTIVLNQLVFEHLFISKNTLKILMKFTCTFPPAVPDIKFKTKQLKDINFRCSLIVNIVQDDHLSSREKTDKYSVQAISYFGKISKFEMYSFLLDIFSRFENNFKNERVIKYLDIVPLSTSNKELNGNAPNKINIRVQKE